MSKPIAHLATALNPWVHHLKRYDTNALLVNDNVAIYLFERCPYQGHLENLLTRNTAQAIYSLFMVDGGFVDVDNPAPALNAAFASFHEIYPHKCYVYKVIEETFAVLTLPYQRQAAGLLFGVPINLHAFCCHQTTIGWVAGFEAAPVWQPRPPFEANNHERPYTYRGKPRPTNAEQHYYDVLGVQRTASVDEVKQAYRRLAQVFHPDLNADPTATDQMQAINEAYRHILKK